MLGQGVFIQNQRYGCRRAFGSPGDVRELIREEVMKLGSPAGGLEMIVGVYPPTPLANVEALMSAMEEYRTYWVGK